MAIKINGEIYQFKHSLEGQDSETIIEIDNSEDKGQTAQIRFTDVNETDPNGRFRWILDGKTMKLQRATAKDWAKSEDILTVDNAGDLTLLLPEDDVSQLLAVLLKDIEEIAFIVGAQFS